MSLSHTTFKKAAKRIRESEFVIPVFIVFFVLWLMSMAFAVEDYWTSFLGYNLLPTQPGFWWTAYVVAALPSVGQIAAGYIAIALGWDSKADRKYTMLSLSIWLMLFLIDAFTDMFFRMAVPDPSWKTALMAVFQTVGIFTIGSELVFVVGFGMAFQLMPDALAQSMTIGVRLKSRMQQIKKSWEALNSQENY